MAICPTAAIQVDGLSYETDFAPLTREEVDAGAFWALLENRRSIRVFKEMPVPREVLERIVEAISLAPMGYTPSKVEVNVVQRRETIERALPLMVELYETLLARMENPVARFVIRRQLEPEAWISLTEHVLPGLAYRLPEMEAGGPDTITRGAPAMLLLHAHREAGHHSQDILIALTYGLLAAHALGLGATAIGLVPPAVNKTPALREMFQIPPDNEVVSSMVVGYPKYRFRRAIRRSLASVRWI
jgi:nitroreductase